MAKEKPADKPAAKTGDKPAAKTGDKPAKSSKSISKTQFYAEIAEHAELSKGQVAAVFDAITGIIHKQLGPKGPGALTLPGLFKLKARRVKAVKGGKSVPNRFKPGETTVTKDKPAHTKVSARPLKGLKELLK